MLLTLFTTLAKIEASQAVIALYERLRPAPGARERLLETYWNNQRQANWRLGTDGITEEPVYGLYPPGGETPYAVISRHG